MAIFSCFVNRRILSVLQQKGRAKYQATHWNLVAPELSEVICNMSESGKKRPASARVPNTSDSNPDLVQPSKSAKISEVTPLQLWSEPEIKLGTIAEPASSQVPDDGEYLDSEIPVSAFQQPQEMLDFSSNELPKQVVENLDEVLRRTTELQHIVDRWIKVTPAERSTYVCLLRSLIHES